MRDIDRLINDLSEKNFKDAQEERRFREIQRSWREEGYISFKSEAWVVALHSTFAHRELRAKQKMETPFLRFAKAQRADVRSSHEFRTFADVGRELGQRWNNLSDEEKSKYMV